ncbi:hypothetical protein EX30DRAFT_64280 [Ascodesmis nigricans]|uniref:Uncharacterized protein n=1 Tax=Ascodesmis nigricans TaxID=341454 RepID=A0A4V6RHE1_9PEZI|nr:hypothetical protein EX30DRAFT_64280 [Ascodesmis nigricans]
MPAAKPQRSSSPIKPPIHPFQRSHFYPHDEFTNHPRHFCCAVYRIGTFTIGWVGCICISHYHSPASLPSIIENHSIHHLTPTHQELRNSTQMLHFYFAAILTPLFTAFVLAVPLPKEMVKRRVEGELKPFVGVWGIGAEIEWCVGASVVVEGGMEV